jgi:hypothetical protein
MQGFGLTLHLNSRLGRWPSDRSAALRPNPVNEKPHDAPPAVEAGISFHVNLNYATPKTMELKNLHGFESPHVALVSRERRQGVEPVTKFVEGRGRDLVNSVPELIRLRTSNEGVESAREQPHAREAGRKPDKAPANLGQVAPRRRSRG